MDGLFDGNTLIQIIIVVIALAVLVFLARFVIGLAMTAVRVVFLLAVVGLVLYLLYLLLA